MTKLLMSAPEKILDDLGITEPEEIDIEAIAYSRGVTITYRHLDECTARIIGSKDRAIISVDDRVTIGRRRFSIGHELGHWENDRGKGAFLCQDRDLKEEDNSEIKGVEISANKFAVDLLLPKYIFQPLVIHKDITFNTVDLVAKRFKVSKTAAAIRLVECGSYPAMVICYCKMGRRWFRRASQFDSDVWPKNELHQDTAAFELLYGDTRQTRTRESPAKYWITDRGAFAYTVYEDSIKLYEDTILTLLWRKG